MCSRQVFAKGEEIAALLGLELTDSKEGMDNAAPTDLTPVITLQDPKKLQYYSWGLRWIENYSGSKRMTTCMRGDKLTTSWKRYLNSKQRCLAISKGFYEFSKVMKEPYFFTVKDQPYTFIAGFWDYTPNVDTGVLEYRYGIVTVEPNELVSKTHDRMPLILTPEDQAKWLDPSASTDDLLALLKPYDQEQMDVKIASKELNNSRNKDFKLDKLIDPKDRSTPEQGTLF
jgi:putative SOS response-associated peptidase YedK